MNERKRCARLAWEYMGLTRYGLEKALDTLAEGYTEEEGLRKQLVAQATVLEALQLRMLDHISSLQKKETEG